MLVWNFNDFAPTYVVRLIDINPKYIGARIPRYTEWRHLWIGGAGRTYRSIGSGLVLKVFEGDASKEWETYKRLSGLTAEAFGLFSFVCDKTTTAILLADAGTPQAFDTYWLHDRSVSVFSYLTSY